MRNWKKEPYKDDKSGTRRLNNTIVEPSSIIDKEFPIFLRIPKLKFKTTDPLPISSRDYGLMKSSNKSSTPYPRAEQGVDANLLKARLKMRSDSENKNHSGLHKKKPEKLEDGSPSISDASSHWTKPTNKSKLSVTVIRRQSLTKNIRDIVSVGTPHPKKGVALNAKVLDRRLTDLGDLIKKTNDLSEQSMVNCVKPKGPKAKRRVLLATPVESRESEISSGASPDGEVVGGSVTQADYDATLGSIIGELQDPQLSFAERRRISQEGEYTIAKNGRKMSDVMMAVPSADEEVFDNSVHFAEKASLEIEKFMRSQGLVKISNDQVTMTRNLTRASAQLSQVGSPYGKPVTSGHERDFL
ncbi:uncharacterized protein LOC6535696 [Drosophila yakuba]|uniref:Uncharacterized protein n=1 Tax=Drosophila yakuba TaxID=7245 RepID=B4PNH3_DROYA|nr:uncharacterized protein LOC6535696 [Drosophila yakuba]EDW96036.1 uncharacterized protein Dyak_GE25124 [Drosophila yakuba]